MKLVSCIMPTRGRQAMANKAVRSFIAQTYPAVELVILDDESDPSFGPDGPEDVRAVYHRHSSRDIAEKRNICAEISAGEYVCHWDSDDWSAPTRIADQIQRIEQFQVAVTGYHSMIFFDSVNNKAYWYENDDSYAIGTSLFYRRDWWQRFNFHCTEPKSNPLWGEDNNFVNDARINKQLKSINAGKLMVATMHLDSTCPKGIDSPIQCSYKPYSMLEMPEEFFK